MEKTAQTLLLIEDLLADRIYFKKLISDTIFKDWLVIEHSNLKDAVQKSNIKDPKIILLDLTLPDSTGHNSYTSLKRNFPKTPIIVLTGTNDLSLANELIKLGAQDYLLKDEVTSSLLSKSIGYAIERHKLKIEHSRFNDLLIDSVMEAEDTERARISKELHDGIVQGLTVLSMKLALLRSQPDKQSNKFTEGFDQCLDVLNDTIKETRSISHSLMPQSITEYGLVDSLEELIQDLQNVTDIKYQLNLRIDTDPTDRLKLAIYRITQELINNALKHSKAKKMVIQLMEYPEQYSLIVEDDGVGFDMEQTLGKKNCFGLHSMESRVHSMNGHFELDSKVGFGTNVAISFEKSNLT